MVITCPHCGKPAAQITAMKKTWESAPSAGRKDADMAVTSFLRGLMVKRGGRLSTERAYAAYLWWAQTHGLPDLSRKMFGLAIRDASIATGKSHGKRYYIMTLDTVDPMNFQLEHMPPRWMIDPDSTMASQ